MRATRSGVVVTAAVLAGVFGVAAPASAAPGNNGQGGEHTNRYNAQGCQQGGHEVRVEAETGRPFRNAGDCTSHAARGGTLAAAAGQITLTASRSYTCTSDAPGQCWGTVSVGGLPAGTVVQVNSISVPGLLWQFSTYPNISSYNANIPCGQSNPDAVYEASALGGALTSKINGINC